MFYQNRNQFNEDKVRLSESTLISGKINLTLNGEETKVYEVVVHSNLRLHSQDV
jgi:hypothetical protein